MTDTQWDGFVLQVLRGLWPRWELNAIQLETWQSKMGFFDYDVLKQACSEHFASSNNTMIPKLDAVIRQAFKIKRQGRTRSEPELAYIVRCLEHENGRKIGQQLKFFSAGENPAAEELERISEHRRKEVELTYGGKWMVIQSWDRSGPKPEDDGLRGRAAAEQAKKNILAGPDTPGRRWLLERQGKTEHLAKHPREKKYRPNREPVSIGAAIDETDIPL